MSQLNLGGLGNLADDVDQAKGMRQIKSYLMQLIEQLRYVLNNLGEENLSPDLAETISAMAERMHYFENALGNYSTVKQTADAIMLEVGKIDESIANIKIKADEIIASVSNIEDDVSLVQQRANEISASVADKASVSYVQQTANSLSSQIGSATSGLVSYSQLTQTLNNFVFTLKNPSVNSALELKIEMLTAVSSYDGVEYVRSAGLGLYWNGAYCGGLTPAGLAENGMSINGVDSLSLFAANGPIIAKIGAPPGYSGAWPKTMEGVGYSVQVTDGVREFVFNNLSRVRPSGSGGTTLGTSSARWGTIYGISSVNTSDERQKKNCKPLQTLDLLGRLNPIRFYWIDETWGTKLNFGLKAQEVAEAIKGTDYEDCELFRDEDPANLHLNYMQLIPVLIEGWQAHDRIIAEQQKRIEALEKRQATLEAQLETLLGGDDLK